MINVTVTTFIGNTVCLQENDFDLIINVLNEIETIKAKVALMQEVIKHAKGLSYGVDWNKGTAAGLHRKPMLDALSKLEASYER